MSINRLNHTWKKQIEAIATDLRKTQKQGMVWLIIGIYISKSVNLGIVAGKIPGKIKRLSNVKRLSRLLKNKAIDVGKIYEPIAKKWIEAQIRSSQQVKLIIDGTKVGYGHQLLMISIAYRRRAIPICWGWVDHVKGHSSVEQQLELLREVKRMIPPGVAVLLVGDSEFGAIDLIKSLESWWWHYVLREKSRLYIWIDEEKEWNTLGNLEVKPGETMWVEQCYLTQQKIHPTSLLIVWKKGEKEPWFLATNLPDANLAKTAYARRMWIEEMFGDMKSNGFDLEKTMLRHADRLSRLTLAVALLYVWMISIGGKTIKNGDRHWVDRNDRRDLSIFQIGLRFLEWLLLNSCDFQISLCRFY